MLAGYYLGSVQKAKQKFLNSEYMMYAYHIYMSIHMQYIPKLEGKPAAF